MKKYLNHYLFMLFSLAVAFITSCKRDDGDRMPISKDGTKPGVITNVKIDNYNGGAHITYTLPKSDNLLYVLAKYQIRNGVSRETKASYYTDTVNVEGFAKEADYEVTLYAVSRSNVMSDAVKVTVHPKTPPYLLIRDQLNLQADFGGVNIQSLNPLKAEVGVILTGLDQTTKAMEVQDQHYTKLDTVDYSVRGYKSEPQNFGVYVTDRFGNISDTLSKTLTPLPEELLDKSKFSTYQLASDSKIGFGWILSNIWDNNINPSSSGWSTEPGAAPAPYVGSWDVGRSYKMSRFILYEKSDSDLKFSFGHGNPKLFTIWGSNVDRPKDVQLPLASPVGTVVGDWVNMGNFKFPDPPSGLPPLAHNSADNAFVAAGVNFNFPLSAPPARYLRFAARETWSGGNFALFLEISLYGQPQ
ncbi:DUF4959 domain-containing protein [Mucilaginibacter rubeus]|uniref:DUF4959 domain-containing protein n=1 Tax=Mucilaginibacter rubeus TaxID=2027860 RepID=A0A5C1I3G5_9SPHI|nr:DUF4959 domain-containing protein [Mucilaginibacter rubeus]QEM11711.1 DUF4959 domain-containing protein [Mucilaginibacter rubeus]